VSKPTSSRQVFAARVERLQLRLAFPPEDADALLRRFCTDDRMHEAWELLAQFDDAAFEDFIHVVLAVVSGMRDQPEQLARYREWRRKMAEVRMIVGQFIEMCETPIQLCDGSSVIIVEKYFPDFFLVPVKKARQALKAEAAYWNDLDPFGDLSRKWGDGRVNMAYRLSHIVKRRTGQPHYEVVAALVNTILDTGGDDEITADAVRKVFKRAVQRGAFDLGQRPDDSTA
jgi:hypothetical protein